MSETIKMKDSGIEWIGEIPKEWTTTRLKFKGDVIIGLSFDPNNLVDESEGVLVLRASNIQDGKISFSDNIYVNCETPKKLKVKKGDILLCSRSGSKNLIGKNCLLSKNEEEMTWGVFMTVFRTPEYKFFYWLFNSQVFKSQSGLFLTSTINQLTVSTLKNLIVSYVPNEIEQKKISDYLERKTQQIDYLIEKTERKIELLKEQRSCLINQCVTKGLDPNVEMKDSSVEWIGEIPKHWKTCKLKHVSTLETGTTPKTSNEGFYQDGDTLWIKPDDLKEFKSISSTKQKLTKKGVDVSRPLKPKAVLVCGIGSIGKFGFSNEVACTNQQINAIIFEDECIDQLFGLYLVSSLSDEFVRLSEKVVVSILNKTNQENTFIVCPPLPEQKQISDYLDKETSKIDQMVATETRRIDLIKEYRQSLISSVVTGKIRVTEDMI